MSFFAGAASTAQICSIIVMRTLDQSSIFATNKHERKRRGEREREREKRRERERGSEGGREGEEEEDEEEEEEGEGRRQGATYPHNSMILPSKQSVIMLI